MDLSAPRLWELCAPTLARPSTGPTASRLPKQVGWGSSRLSLREFQSFYRKWLSTPELRAKLARKLRRGSFCANERIAAAAAAAAAAERRCSLQTNRPTSPLHSGSTGASAVAGVGNDVDIDTDDGLEASIDEMIELPEAGMGMQSLGHGVQVPFQLAISMHPSSAATAAMAAQSSQRSVGSGSTGTSAGGGQVFAASVSPEESLVVELLRGCERLEQEKAGLSRQMDEMLVEHDSMERRLFEVELEKRGLTTLLEKEAKAKQHAEDALKTRESQWHGIGTEPLSDAELDDLLKQVRNSVPFR